jgi:SAM-dependent methyltransferase
MKIIGPLAMWRNRAQREKIYSTSAYWDAKASELEGDAASMWPNNTLNALYHKERMAVISSATGSLTGKNILEVGSGTGNLARFLAELGANVVGIDFSGKAVTIARSNSPSGNPFYRELSVFDLRDECTYDMIVSWGSIVFAAANRIDLLAAMRILRRAAKPGATALLLEPVHRGLVHRVLNIDLTEFCQVMREAGFRVEWVREMHFWPMRFALAFVNWPVWITGPCYHIGQMLMRLPGFRGMGDYKAIKAVAA